MLTQLHTAADLAADHRRTLQAEADAYRLARTVRGERTITCTSSRPHRWLSLLRPAGRRATGAA
jgi:hypothetical protein